MIAIAASVGRTRAAWLTLAVIATGGTRASAQSLVITHVTVVDVRQGSVLHDRTVRIQGTWIAQIDSGVPPAIPGANTIDGTGRFLMPGLWDMHVHLAGNDSAAARMLTGGITGARDMGGRLDRILALRDGIRSGRLRGPRLVIAGPALRGPRSPSDSGPDVVRSPDQATQVVDTLARRGVDFIKVHEDLTPETWFAIARAARRRGLMLVGHVPAALTPEQTADSGEHSIEHLEFIPDRCLSLFDSTVQATRASPPAGCGAPDLRRLLEHLHHHGVWLDPTIGSFRVWAPRQWPSIKAGFASLTPMIASVGLPLLAGTDFGDSHFVAGESLHDELALLVEAGFAPAEVLRAATINPAVFLGLSDSLGAVQPGFIADLVLLDGDPLADIRNTRRIAAVIQGGTLLLKGSR